MPLPYKAELCKAMASRGQRRAGLTNPLFVCSIRKAERYKLCLRELRRVRTYLESRCGAHLLFDALALLTKLWFVRKTKENHANLKLLFFKQFMTNTGTTGRIPLWLVGTIIGTAALVLGSILFYGSYVGLGSSL